MHENTLYNNFLEHEKIKIALLEQNKQALENIRKIKSGEQQNDNTKHI